IVEGTRERVQIFEGVVIKRGRPECHCVTDQQLPFRSIDFDA
ncbi:MAG: hypothetical protein DBX48_03130, partial [Limosilactobacillus fermentum]